jgi:hypothetical protein
MLRTMSGAGQGGARGRGALALMLVTWGCARPGGDLEPPAQASVRGAGAPPLATDTAFDLVPSSSGAVLGWAPSGAGVLRVTRFDAEGRAQPFASAAAAVELRDIGARAADMAVSAGSEGVAVAWSETVASARRLRAAWVSPNGSSRSFELGEAAPLEVTRGALALAGREGGALLLARGAAALCASPSDGTCSEFRFFQIHPDAALPTGLSLTVPSPCEARSAQLVAPRTSAGAAANGRFDYAICSGVGPARALTVFSIQPNPAYAAAEEVFAGCTPLGAGRFAGDAVFVARCGSGRRMATVPAEGGEIGVQDLDERGLVCGAHGPTLRLGRTWLRPGEPLGDLELLLNDDIAPHGARAVWAGSVLLVARLEEGHLRLTRHACRGSSLVELQEAADAGI